MEKTDTKTKAKAKTKAPAMKEIPVTVRNTQEVIGARQACNAVLRAKDKMQKNGKLVYNGHEYSVSDMETAAGILDAVCDSWMLHRVVIKNPA